VPVPVPVPVPVLEPGPELEPVDDVEPVPMLDGLVLYKHWQHCLYLSDTLLSMTPVKFMLFTEFFKSVQVFHDVGTAHWFRKGLVTGLLKFWLIVLVVDTRLFNVIDWNAPAAVAVDVYAALPWQ